MFEAIFNQSPVPCAILVQGRLLSRCNDAFARLLGYQRDELLGHPMHPLMEDTVEPVLHCDRGGGSRAISFKHKTGELLKLNCTTSPLHSESGLNGTILQVMELPARIQTLAKPTTGSGTTLADLAFDYIQEAVYLIGDHGRILDTNQAACDILGYSREELVQLSVSDIDPQFNFIPDAVETVEPTHNSTPILDTVHQRKNGEVFPVKIRTVNVQRSGKTYSLCIALDLSEEKRLGAMRLGILESLARGDSHQGSLQRIVDYVEALHPETIASIMLVNEAGTHLVPVRSPAGTFDRVVVITRDVTEHRRAEHLLHAREQELRALVEHSPDGIIRYDRKGNPSYVNPAMKRILGDRQGGVQGNWMLSQDEEDYEQALKSALFSGSESRLMVRWNGADACVRDGDVHFVPEFKDELGRTMSVLVVGRDITRQKAIDIELRESRSLLRELGSRREAELEAERKRIAHEIHDELGQLLTALRMNVSLVRTQLKPGNEGPRERLSDITKLVDQTIQTVRNIATSLRPAVLNAGIDSALEWLTEEFARHTGIQCHLDINNDVQLNEERSIVVFRVVQESLSNVGRHSQATQIWIRLHRCNNAFHLTISDNGCGFNPNSKTSRQSFGLLGMRERALSLGGTLDLTSSPGSGTLLKLSIPNQ